MSKKTTKHPGEEEIVDISGAEKYVENNIQKILIGIGVIIALAAIIIIITGNSNSKEIKAEAAAAGAQEAFANQDWDLTLNGDENSMGMLTIADEYSKTRIGNLAHYYAGISYIKLGEFEKAIESLQQFKSTKDPNINGLAYMNLGDALSEVNNFDEALNYYKKAAQSGSEAFSPDFLFRYGLAQINAEDFDGARSTLEKITTEYPNSSQANSAEQYLAAL